MSEDPMAVARRRQRVLVNRLKRQGLRRSPLVEAAFRAVPRHLFLPDVPLETVYRDEAIITKVQDGRGISSSSQPAIMAIMLEQLDLAPGLRVLEIGAGTGFNAALVAHIVGPTGHVVTVDIDDDIVVGAREHLAAAGFPEVEVVCGDGGLGYAPSAPYDRIILTVGAWDVPPAWWEQLKPGGRLVLPLSLRGVQLCVAFDDIDGRLVSASVHGCGFIPLRGAFGGHPIRVRLPGDPNRILVLEDQRVLAEQASIFVAGPTHDRGFTGGTLSAGYGHPSPRRAGRWVHRIAASGDGAAPVALGPRAPQRS